MSLLAVAVAASYVVAIHFNKPHTIANLPRNDPKVVVHRMKRASTLCLVLLLALPPVLVYNKYYPSLSSVYRQFGLVPGFTQTHDAVKDIKAIFSSLCKICILYMGPLCHYLFFEERYSFLDDLQQDFTTLFGFRDHVFAPATEEFVYRAAVVAVLLPTSSTSKIVWLSPLLFGIAHLHHGYHLYVHEKAPFAVAAATVGFQLVYTYLFGALACHLYVKSEYNLWSPMVVHMMCNLNGFPAFDMKQTHPRWFCVYCGMLIVGTALFFWVL